MKTIELSYNGRVITCQPKKWNARLRLKIVEFDERKNQVADAQSAKAKAVDANMKTRLEQLKEDHKRMLKRHPHLEEVNTNDVTVPEAFKAEMQQYENEKKIVYGDVSRGYSTILLQHQAELTLIELERCKEFVDTSLLSAEDAELINSDIKSDFWLTQDEETVAQFNASF